VKHDNEAVEGRRNSQPSNPDQIRQGIWVRAEARAVTEDVSRTSCCAPVRLRRRAKQELRGREPFDDAHGSAADWTVPE
jgi:hypothetical protein